MIPFPKKCPHCDCKEIRKSGVSGAGRQRFVCANAECKRTFQGEYKFKAWKPGICSEIYFLTIEGNGISATSRILGIARDTILTRLRNIKSSSWYINSAYLGAKNNSNIDVEIVSGTKADMDEMWSFIQDKSRQHWLWWAIDRNSGEPVAFCFGVGQDKHLNELSELLNSFGIAAIFSDAHTSKISAETLKTWRSRLVRKDVKFS